MPEIAEVETVRNVLKKKILNKKIIDVNILYNKIIIGNINEFKNILINNKIIDIKRKAKWLIFELDNYYLLSHLRMEGKYFIKNNTDPIEKHEHIIITFDDNTDLRYHDTRKFGRLKIIKKEKLNNELKELGPEVLDDINPNYLLDKLKNKKLPIKTILLDQSIISGLGNIYADEVLFASNINPLKKGSNINIDEANKIITTSKEIIKEAIKHGGTTIKSYTSSLGVTGSYQDYLKVHKRENKLCKVCNSKIIRIKVNGRSTYYCPICQK